MTASPNIARRVADTFRRAAEANRGDGRRRGNVVALGPEDGDEVMITADLHGHRLNFEKLVALAELAEHPRRHLIMQEVCHGGPLYPSGTGDMSHLMLEDVARLKVEFPGQFHFLLSNHEWAELVDYPISKAGRMLNLLFRCGLQEIYGDLTDDVRLAYLDFLQSCPLAARIGQGVLVCHSAPEAVDREGFDASIFDRPLTSDDMQAGGAVYRLLWGRDFRPANAEAFARLVGAEVLIHGHEPCARGFSTPNERQVILDCCGQPACYVTLPLAGRLAQRDVVDRIQYL